MKIAIILYEYTENDYRALYTFSQLEMEQSIQERLKDAQRLRRKREETLKKARALGLSCISGGKSRKKAINFL